MDSELLISNNKKIRQSNVLVEATYAQEFTATELKIFEVILSCCTPTDIELYKARLDKEVIFTRAELAKILHVNPSIISQEAYRISSSLMKKYIEIKNILNDGTIEFQQIGIMPYCQYINGVLTIHWNYRLLPFLLEIKSNFTEYQLHHLLSLNSAYAIKLYKLLYQYKKIKSRCFLVNELKKQFGIHEKYAEYKSFKQRVIDPSIRQINDSTDLIVQYNEIKIGRRVEKIEFTFELKKSENLETKQIDIINTVSNTEVNYINEEFVNELSTQTKDLILRYNFEKGNDYVDACIIYAKRNAKTNFDKYLADTLTNGWAEVEIKKSKAKKANETAKVMIVKNESEKKRLEKEQENLAKSEIEHMWSKLLDSEKHNYLKYTDFILNKYASKLTSLPALDQRLPLCIYAVSNDKFYDRTLELYIKNMLNISLNINNFIIKE